MNIQEKLLIRPHKKRRHGCPYLSEVYADGEYIGMAVKADHADLWAGTWNMIPVDQKAYKYASKEDAIKYLVEWRDRCRERFDSQSCNK